MRHIPIIASVSEHQPTTWTSFFFGKITDKFSFTLMTNFFFILFADYEMFFLILTCMWLSMRPYVPLLTAWFCFFILLLNFVSSMHSKTFYCYWLYCLNCTFKDYITLHLYWPIPCTFIDLLVKRFFYTKNTLSNKRENKVLSHLWLTKDCFFVAWVFLTVLFFEDLIFYPYRICRALLTTYDYILKHQFMYWRYIGVICLNFLLFSLCTLHFHRRQAVAAKGAFVITVYQKQKVHRKKW